MSILNALRGITGEFEIQRVLGAVGTLTYIFTAPALVWAGLVSVTFDTFCIAFPTGLAACIGATAGSIALKDRQTATASILAKTGAVPVPPPPKDAREAADAVAGAATDRASQISGDAPTPPPADNS